MSLEQRIREMVRIQAVEPGMVAEALGISSQQADAILTEMFEAGQLAGGAPVGDGLTWYIGPEYRDE